MFPVTRPTLFSQLSNPGGFVGITLAYPTLVRLRELDEKRAWPSRSGLIVIRCQPFCPGVPVKPISVIIEILHEAFFLLDLTFHSDSCVSIIKLIPNASYKLIKVRIGVAVKCGTNNNKI